MQNAKNSKASLAPSLKKSWLQFSGVPKMEEDFFCHYRLSLKNWVPHMSLHNHVKDLDLSIVSFNTKILCCHQELMQENIPELYISA